MTETSLIVLGLKRNLQAVENTDIRKVALKKNHCRNSEIQLFHFNIARHHRERVHTMQVKMI